MYNDYIRTSQLPLTSLYKYTEILEFNILYNSIFFWFVLMGYYPFFGRLSAREEMVVYRSVTTLECFVSGIKNLSKV